MSNENTDIRKTPESVEDTHTDVGIVGLWYGLNYGSILTYYALYDVITKMGYSAMMVNKPDVLWRPIYTEKDTIANKFIYKYCDNNVTRCYQSSMDYQVLNKNCDTFIVGSDVVWNYRICGKEGGQFFFLDFVDDSKKKIAMASSFGEGYDAPEEDRMWSEYYLKKFDYIGVREDSAVKLVKDMFHADADRIMDPVFLCDRQVYHDLADSSKIEDNAKFITSYFLGPRDQKTKMILRIAEMLGSEYRCVPNPNNPGAFTERTGLEAIKTPDVEDWLYYFKHTQCYVGDSFHGLCFALIFGKPFVCVVENGQSLARFETLLEMVGLSDRLINISKENLAIPVIRKRVRALLNKKIDYEKVWQILDEKAEFSRQWLRNAISSEKKVSKNASQVRMLRSPKMDCPDPITVAGLAEEVCTGCTACLNVCPVDAITMKENDDGFIVPSVNTDKCIRCSKCVKRCPSINLNVNNSLHPEIHAAMADDSIRGKSSSGGMFTLAAEAVLDKGGYVCGAAFDYKTLSVNHVIIHSKEELAPLRKSKYSQSNIGTVYRDIEALLKDDKKVLFTGTPCQVAGLKAFLNKTYDNLYLIDILCSGVPSQKITRTYIEEIARRPEISGGETPPALKYIDFRDKEHHNWRSCQYIRLEFDNGVVYDGGLQNRDPFEKLYHNRTGMRRSCQDCYFSAFPRQGDISIGDFWGIELLDKSIDDNRGTSMILINNVHGKELFDMMSGGLQQHKRMNIPTSKLVYNRCTAKKKPNPKRERIMSLVKSHTLKKSIDMADYKHFDVGLVCNYYTVNFGGAMTHYALYNILEDLGYSTMMIERPRSSKNSDNVMNAYNNIHAAPLFPEYALSNTYLSKDDMRNDLNNLCDTFVVGSDKLLNYNIYTAMDNYTSLDWVTDARKKIAFSTSFGQIHGDAILHNELAFYLQRFDFFAGHDETDVKNAREYYSLDNAEWVLDPILLCGTKHFEALAARSKRITPDSFVSAYILDPTDEKTDILRRFAENFNGECQVFSEYMRNSDYYKPFGSLFTGDMKTEDRLKCMLDSDFFVTDSIHGVYLAIAMKKQFAAIVNGKRDAEWFYDIAKLLRLEDRLINNISDLDTFDFDSKIDYNKVYEILDAHRAKAINWLKKALAAPKKPVMSEYDIMRGLLAEQETKINNLKDLILAMTTNINEEISDKTDLLEYLDCLKDELDKNLVIIAVKDTPGLALNSLVSEGLQALGLKTDLKAKHSHSYIAVINSGKVVYEKLGQDNQPTIYNGQIGSNSVYVTSRVYTNGNEAIIRINDKDYSINSRGLNIVIYNKDEHKLVDSVVFDTHIRTYNCRR